MAAAGQEIEAGAGLGGRFGLGQDAAADGHHGIGGEDEGAIAVRRLRLGAREALGVRAGRFALEGRFVGVGRGDGIWRDADLGQQGQAARAGGCQDQWRQDVGSLARRRGHVCDRGRPI